MPTKKDVPRYRVKSVSLKNRIYDQGLEDWLNEATKDHSIYEIIKYEDKLIFIQSIPCRIIRRRRPPPVTKEVKKVVKKKPTAKK